MKCKALVFGLSLVLAAPCFGTTFNELKAALKQPVPEFSQDDQPIQAAIQLLGRMYRVTIQVDEDVTGNVTIECYNTTVQGALETICFRDGYYVELNEGGFVSVSRFKTVAYSVDYFQLERNMQGSASVTLGGNQGFNNQYGQQGGLAFGGQSTVATAGNNNGSGNNSGNSDVTQVSVTQTSKNAFWASVEEAIKGQFNSKDETVVIDKFAGLAHVKAGARTHGKVQRCLDRVHRRIGRQVYISAKILEVDLNNSSKLGIDWRAASFSIGQHIRVGGAVTAPSTGNVVSGLTGMTNLTSAGGSNLSPDTFTGTIGVGKVDAVISALQEQGNVKVTNEPQISTMNNQMGFLKDATDQTFFGMQSQVTVNSGSTASNGQTVAGTQFIRQTYSIGNILVVTPQVNDDDIITLDILPALSRLEGVDTSPDNLQTAPRLKNRQAPTLVRIRSGETAIIGGIIMESESDSRRSIPVLGNLPVVGAAFRTDGKVKQRSELVILVTASLPEESKRKPAAVTEVPQAAAQPVESINLLKLDAPNTSPANTAAK